MIMKLSFTIKLGKTNMNISNYIIMKNFTEEQMIQMTQLKLTKKSFSHWSFDLKFEKQIKYFKK